MSVEENKRVVRRFIHEGVIGGDLTVIDELCSPECINHSAVPEARHGTEGVKRVVRFSRAAMPDQRWTNEMIIAEGDLVVIHGIRHATWQADAFRGQPTPKGKSVAVELVHIFRVRHGKIVERDRASTHSSVLSFPRWRIAGKGGCGDASFGAGVAEDTNDARRAKPSGEGVGAPGGRRSRAGRRRARPSAVQ